MNKIIEGKDFWISYNLFTDKGAETALCRETARPSYLILLGDYISDFEPLVSQGYDACLEKFKQLVNGGAEMSGWSESLEDETDVDVLSNSRGLIKKEFDDKRFDTKDVQVAPGIWQSKEDYDANMAYDSMRDNQE